jgi:hypothetical protein
MKEYQYSIIRRESRNPKRNREGRGVSQSDLEALRRELEGESRGIVSAVNDRDVALDSLAVTSTDISERLGAAEEGLRGKLDSGEFSQWRTGDLAKALASKQPAGSYVDPSQLATSQQQAVAEAVKQAEEMDKQIKVGGRNLFRKEYFIGDITSSYKIPLDALQPREGDNTYTLSLDYKISPEDKASSPRITCFYAGNKNIFWDSNVVRDGEWHHKEYTIKLDIDPSKYPIYGWFTDYSSANGRTIDMVAVRNIKLERGSIATDWTPAPEDLDDSIYKLTSQLEKHGKTLGSQAEALEVMAGSVERLSEQYSIEACTIGAPILKSDTDQYVIQCRVIHTPTGTDYTDELLRSARLVTPEWYRINPERHDRTGLSDEEWANRHRGDAEVVITRNDFITSCTVGYKIPRKQIIDAINTLEH